MASSAEYAGNESNETNFINGFDLPCNVVCVAATGGGVLFLVVTASTLLIICLCLLKLKRGQEGRVEETSAEDIHDYVNIASNNFPGSMGVRQPPQEPRTSDIRDSHYYEPVDRVVTNVEPETGEYGIVLGTIDSNDYEDVLA